MKLIVCLFFMATLVLHGQPYGFIEKEGEQSTKIKSSIKAGNAKELTAFFAQDIELMIDSEKVEFSKISTPQAEQILKSFFKKRPPKDFQYVYQGNAATLKYSTGTYVSGSESFLVYILMKKSGQQYVIETLHFRKESPKMAIK